MNNETLISVTRLSRYYGKLAAVDDLSFELRRGEVLGFLGPNGAGKTTTMQMLCGTLAPSAGSIRIVGVDLLEQPREAKHQLGYLPEQPPLYRELTVDEYLHYCSRLRGLSRPSSAAAVARAKGRCGLDSSGSRLIANLSKGYQQRVGIAQAILHRPAVVVLDEPTVGLDPIQIREIRSLIRELGEDHGVILSTHILPEVQAVCDRVQIIHQGRLVLNENREQLAHRTGQRVLRLGLRRPPSQDLLAAIAGVQRVEALADERWRLTFSDDTGSAEELAARATTADWGMFELVSEQRSLEEIFVELTCGESFVEDQASSEAS